MGMFYGSALLNISCFGACAAQIPAYISDLYGQKYAAAIHGQILSQVSIFGFVGPIICTRLRSIAEHSAIADLSTMVGEDQFQRQFGAPSTCMESLIDAKTINIARLMEIVPPGTQDPTPFLYDNTMMILAGFSLVTLGCNAAIKPVQARFIEK
jgi:hypothetical protein